MKFGAVVCMQLSGLQTLGPALEYARQSHFLQPHRKAAHTLREVLQALQQIGMSDHLNTMHTLTRAFTLSFQGYTDTYVTAK